MQFYNLKIIKIFDVEKNIKKKSSYILSNNKTLLKNFFYKDDIYTKTIAQHI